MFYISIWILHYLRLLSKGRSGLWWVLLGFEVISLSALVLFRDSGTDTGAVYRPMVRSILQNAPGIGTLYIESGFRSLVIALSWLTPSDTTIVGVLGLINVVLFYAIYFYADKKVRFVFDWFIFPSFIFQISMNAIRNGFSLLLVILAVLSYMRKASLVFYMSFFASLLIHLSAIYFFITSILHKFNVRVLLYLLTCMPFLFLVFAHQYDYILVKLLFYRNYAAPTEMSGLSRVVIGLTIFVGALFCGANYAMYRRISLIYTAILFVLYFAVQYSYAFLRFLDLTLIGYGLALAMTQPGRGLEAFPRCLRAAVVFAGFLGAAAAYRNFLADYDGAMTGTPTPFLPYRATDILGSN